MGQDTGGLAHNLEHIDVNEMTTVILYLPLEEADLFKSFRQHQDTFTLLVNSGMFNLNRGEAKLSFGDGVITDIDVSVKAYKRKADKPQEITFIIDNRNLQKKK